MRNFVIAASMCAVSFGFVGATPTLADGMTNGASIKAVGSQVTREATKQTSRQVSSAASQATRDSAGR